MAQMRCWTTYTKKQPNTRRFQPFELVFRVSAWLEDLHRLLYSHFEIAIWQKRTL